MFYDFGTFDLLLFINFGDREWNSGSVPYSCRKPCPQPLYFVSVLSDVFF